MRPLKRRVNLVVKREGFTLLEVMIASLILVSVIAGMLAVFVVGRRSVGFAGHRTQALDFARETLEDLKGNVGGYLWPDGTFGKDDLNEWVDRATPALTGDLADLGGVRTYTVENVPAGSADGLENYKRVTVRVRWDEPE